MMNIINLQKMKANNNKIVMVTCYDYTSARIVARPEAAVDCVLVGDSLAMVMHGYPTTVHATVDMMCMHTEAVARGAVNKFIIADMPFLSYRKGLVSAMQTVERLMQAGAHAVKLEGAEGNEEIVRHIVASGVPVMGHIGMTPQSVHQMGGFRVQGKQAESAEKIKRDALTLQQAGCFAVVLECVPSKLAQEITASLSIPTIGIGAGPHVDGQVLVFQDLLGMDPDLNIKLFKKYADGFALVQSALNGYSAEVKQGKFPTAEHCYD